jgi:hypothetical protein
LLVAALVSLAVTPPAAAGLGGRAHQVRGLSATDDWLALAAPAASADALAAECARLREQLERTNAEISALKRADRGVRDDYRLRKKMADAEALARQLTDAETELRRVRPERAAETRPVPAPRPELADSPSALEAKADILSDQARRLVAEASALARGAAQLRGREALRRRAGRLDQDPFASLDASKRFMIVRSAGKAGAEATGNFSGGKSADSAPRSGAPGMGGATSTPAAAPGTPTPPPPAGPAPGATTAPTAQPPAPTSTPTTPPTSPPPVATDSTSPPPAPPVAPTVTGPAPTQSRTLLDPAALAEIRRIEAGGKPLTELEKMERTAALLQARAQVLEAEARALRARAAQR